MKKIIAVVVCLQLGACAGGGGSGGAPDAAAASTPASTGPATTPPVTTAPVSAIDPKDFLVPWVCDDGRLEIANPGCTSHPMTSSEPQKMRIHDLAGSNSTPAGYQVATGWMLKDRPDHYVAPYSYDPWLERKAPNDGGEIFVVAGDNVRVELTQDGGKPYIQVFQGPECGGDGWFLWATSELKLQAWSQRVARLAIGQLGQACQPMGQALTRYRIEYVDMTVLVDDQPVQRRVKTIIVQHYDFDTISKSQQLEEFYFGEHIGRYRWSAYNTNPTPAGADLGMRCPYRPYTGDSDARFKLSDCRDLTNYRTADGSMTGDRYGWPNVPVP